MQTTVVNYTRKPGMTLSEAIDIDNAQLRSIVEDGTFFALQLPGGRVAYIESDGAPAELLLMALTPEQLLTAQNEQKRRAIMRVS